MLTVAQIGQGGAVVNSSDEIRTSLITQLETEIAGYTVNVPAEFTEDMLGTSNVSVAMCIGSAVDAQNCIGAASVTPEILNDIADSNGIKPQGYFTRTSVWVQFSGAAGTFIPKGTLVSGGGVTFETRDSVGISTLGYSNYVLCICTQDGAFIVPPNTINTVSRTGVTVTNPQAAVAGSGIEPLPEFRARVLQSQRDMGQGSFTRLKRMLSNIDGVQNRLISVRCDQFGLRVIVGGEHDSYEVGMAIYSNVLMPRSLIHSLDNPARNRTVQIDDYPDFVTIKYIAPEPQITSITAVYDLWGDGGKTWRQVIDDTMKAVIVEYVNTLNISRPLSLIMLKKFLLEAVVPLLHDGVEISTLDFTVSLNQVAATPRQGTEDIYIDAETYFLTDENNVFIHRIVNI